MTTLADRIVFALTDEIVGKRLAPGVTLDEGRLGQRFGASRTPVREALRQLAASGLVELRTHRAPRVAAIDEASVADMFEAMAELEALCAARAATRLDGEARARLHALHHAMGAMARAGDVASYRTGNVEFHLAIYAASGNGYLEELARQPRKRLAPYRGAQLEVPERLALSHAEHGAILAALGAGDAEGAARHVRAHLGSTREALAALVVHGSPAS